MRYRCKRAELLRHAFPKLQGMVLLLLVRRAMGPRGRHSIDYTVAKRETSTRSTRGSACGRGVPSICSFPKAISTRLDGVKLNGDIRVYEARSFQ